MADGTRMQQRRATEADWATSNYVLAAGEIGVTTDTGIIKVGNGTTPWVDLDPAFGSLYLPILGTASNSDLLGGISSSGFVKTIDAVTLPTEDKVVRRTAEGRVKFQNGFDDLDGANMVQLNSAITGALQRTVVRTVTTATSLVTTDVARVVMVNHASTTAQVVVTIPTNTSSPFPVGSFVDISAIGNGGAKLTPSGGVTLRGAANVMPNYGLVRLLKLATNEWLGIPLRAGRQPRIRVKRSTAGITYTAWTETAIPYDVVEAGDTYNPDNDWFEIPGTGLPTARRIIIKRDGEYLISSNFNGSVATQGWLRICTMTADNTIGERKFSGNTFTTGFVTGSLRLAAGTSIGGVHAIKDVNNTDSPDGTAASRNDFTIVRIGD